MSGSESDKRMDESISAHSKVQQWLQMTTNTMEVLEGNRERGEFIFHQLQVSRGTLMGMLALETGGILFDHGWVRFLGSGSERMKGDLLNWNSTSDGYSLQNAFIVAYDIIGGFFAINGGAFSGRKGNIFYLAPETLSWQDFGGSYSQLFSWAMTGNLEQFYHNIHWPSWQDEVSNISGDQGFSIIPFLWTGTNEPPIAERSRRAVPMRELWSFEQDLAHQIRHLSPGTPIKIKFT